MATHEQTFLGPIFDELIAEGYIDYVEGENGYGVAAEFARRATAAGVVIHADEACADCAAEQLPAFDAARLARALKVTEDERHDFRDGNCLGPDEEADVVAAAYEADLGAHV